MSEDQAREILACAKVLAHWYPHEQGLSRLIHIFTAGPDEPWVPPTGMSASENPRPAPVDLSWVTFEPPPKRAKLWAGLAIAVPALFIAALVVYFVWSVTR